MGLFKPALEFLIREHLRQPLSGPLLTLGRQAVYATPEEIERMCSRAGVVPQEADETEDAHTNIPQWQGTPNAKYASDRAFFRNLGLREVLAMDCSEYEGADILADLNAPIDTRLENRFGCVVDGGTTEHVFNTRQCLMNIARLVRPGGRVIHFSPMNNYANHGFYQLSPTLFYDYYATNEFTGLRGYVIEQSVSLRGRTHWSLYEWNSARGDHHMTSRKQLLFIFIAEKETCSTADKIPVQSWYDRQFSAANTVEPGTTVQLRDVWRGLPLWVQIPLRRFVPRLDPARRPWRLKRTARLA